MHLHLQRTGPEIDRLVATRFDGVLLNHASLVAGGEFLDVGCGLGDMVAAMQRAGMNAHSLQHTPQPLLMLRCPHHLEHFTKRTLERVAERSGLCCTDIATELLVSSV